MFLIRKIAFTLRRIGAPVLLFGVVAASGYLMQATRGPDAAPGATSATR